MIEALTSHAIAPRKLAQPNIMFGGLPDKLELAYPEPVVDRARARTIVLPGECSERSWRGAEESLAEVEYMLATWGMAPLETALLACAPRLKAVFYAAGSVKFFATPEAFERGILICSAWEANAIPVAEYTMATIFLSLKNFWHYTRQTREQRSWDLGFPITGGYQATIGIVSLGAVGKCLAKLLQSYDLRVICHDPLVTWEVAERYDVELVSLEEIFSESDVISINTPWLPETENLVNAPRLRAMKPYATLINTSRGPLVNEEDLCEVLREREDLTAIIDVTVIEPPPIDSPLFDLPNIIQTPHIAGSKGGEVARMGNWMVDELFRHLARDPLRYEVTPAMLAQMA